jgi:hypothetical protein
MQSTVRRDGAEDQPTTQKPEERASRDVSRFLSVAPEFLDDDLQRGPTSPRDLVASLVDFRDNSRASVGYRASYFTPRPDLFAGTTRGKYYPGSVLFGTSGHSSGLL